MIAPFLITLIIITAVLAIAYRFAFPPAIAMTPAEARSAIKHHDIAAIVDVRTSEEWATGHARNAIHIPINQIAAALPHNIQSRGAPILFYCRTGRRAADAAQIAQELGYRHVYYLRDGDYTDLAIKTRFAKY